MSTAPLYDRIGRGYRETRRPDPRLAAEIWRALGEARTVINVGAGTGSYEPPDLQVLAVEPSDVMIAQRAPDAAPVIKAFAESLPLADQTVDAALAVLTLQHWANVERGVAELVRVARDRVVLVTLDVDVLRELWLIRDYLREALPWHLHAFPSIARLRTALPNASVRPLPVPCDCTDGFMAAFWARPEAYLGSQIREASSPWHELPPEAVDRALAELRNDLSSGAWDRRYGRLRQAATHDVGLRLVVATPLR